MREYVLKSPSSLQAYYWGCFIFKSYNFLKNIFFFFFLTRNKISCCLKNRQRVIILPPWQRHINKVSLLVYTLFWCYHTWLVVLPQSCFRQFRTLARMVTGPHSFQPLLYFLRLVRLRVLSQCARHWNPLRPLQCHFVLGLPWFS